MKKGDRVSIYMPMVVELVVAMLACVRIGAVHSIVVTVAGDAVADRRVGGKGHGRALTLCSVCRLFRRVPVRADPGLPVPPAHHRRWVPSWKQQANANC